MKSCNQDKVQNLNKFKQIKINACQLTTKVHLYCHYFYYYYQKLNGYPRNRLDMCNNFPFPRLYFYPSIYIMYCSSTYDLRCEESKATTCCYYVHINVLTVIKYGEKFQKSYIKYRCLILHLLIIFLHNAHIYIFFFCPFQVQIHRFSYNAYIHMYARKYFSFFHKGRLDCDSSRNDILNLNVCFVMLIMQLYYLRNLFETVKLFILIRLRIHKFINFKQILGL